MGKPIAKGDRCYCNATDCKKDCWRNSKNWTFEKGMWYSFIEKCTEYKEE